MPIQLKLLRAAIAEAERFLERAEALRGDLLKLKDDSDYSYSNANNASVMRARIDLTKALSALGRSSR